MSQTSKRETIIIQHIVFALCVMMCTWKVKQILFSLKDLHEPISHECLSPRLFLF